MTLPIASGALSAEIASAHNDGTLSFSNGFQSDVWNEEQRLEPTVTTEVEVSTATSLRRSGDNISSSPRGEKRWYELARWSQEFPIAKRYRRHEATEQDMRRLYHAIEKGREKKAIALMDKKAFDSDTKFSALASASQNQQEVLVERLLEYIDINALSARGETVLSVATASGTSNLVKLLLQKGAKSIENDSGKLPLHIAVENGDYDKVRLLSKNKNPFVPTKCGYSPFELALHKQNLDVVTLFLEPYVTSVLNTGKVLCANEIGSSFNQCNLSEQSKALIMKAVTDIADRYTSSYEEQGSRSFIERTMSSPRSPRRYSLQGI